MERLPSYQTLRRMMYFAAIAEVGVILAVRTARAFRLTDADERVRAGMGAALLIDLGLDDGFEPVDADLDFGAVAMEVVLRDPLPSLEVAAFLAMDGIAGLPVGGRDG